MHIRHRIRPALIAAGTAVITTLASAQPAASTQPIRLVVGFSAGGPTDVVARAFADFAGRALGQPVIVDNKPGAGGTIGGAQVAAAAKPGDIHMIASVTCVYCAAARAWFDENRVSFTECLIERDADCAAKYNALMAPGTPVMLVRGKRLLGFSAQAIADALATKPL